MGNVSVLMVVAGAGLLLLVLLGWVLARVLSSRRTAAGSRRRYALSSASNAAMGAHASPGYSPTHVGNDASARPWELSTFEDPAPTSAVAPQAAYPGFDVDGFLRASKSNFISLQDAWDRADLASLRSMLTDTMLTDLQIQLAERERSGAGAGRTEVVMLEARLLGMEQAPDGQLASVEFSGLIREDPSAGANPFCEIWSITRPKNGPDGWLVAGVQALQ